MRFDVENLASVVNTNFFDEEIETMTARYADSNYGPYRYCVNATCNVIESKFSEPRRPSFKTIAIAESVRVDYDMTGPNHFDAIMSLVVIVVILIVITAGSLVMKNAVDALAVKPLERMLDSVQQVAEIVFKSAKAIGSDDKELDQTGEHSEITMLEQVVERVASMAELHMQSDLVVTIDSSKINKEDRAVLETIGKRVQHTTKKDPLKHAAKIKEKRLFRDEGDDGLGLLKSWDFDFISLKSDKERTEHLMDMILNYPATRDWVENHVDRETLKTFLMEAELGYTKVQAAPKYHSWAHGCDVAHCVFYYFLQVKVDMFLSSLEQFSILISAVCHDMGHMGFNNPFLIETGDTLAILYNDQSPLENMHCAKMFDIVKEEKTNIFSKLPREKYQESRKLCIDVILHTDMINHFPMLKSLTMIYEMNAAVFDANKLDLSCPEEFEQTPQEIQVLAEADNRRQMCCLFLHSADVSNPCRPWDSCYAWSCKVLEEFFIQGDREKRLRIPVGILNDRTKVNREKSQIGFMEFIIAPLVQAELNLLPQMFFKSDCLKANIKQWETSWTESKPAPSQKETQETHTRIKGVIEKLDAASGRIMKSVSSRKPSL